MKTFKKILACALAVCTIMSCFVFTASSASSEYEKHLKSLGFPDSYIPLLSKLHDVHPNWVFECDNITAMKSTYTWSYVQTQEQAAGNDYQRNLIDKAYGNKYPVYARNQQAVESGSWLRASNSCIAYFSDPRNFLNEDNVFQFEKLSYSSIMSESVVEAVLQGSFMAHAVIPDSGNSQTYAQFFVQLGKELNISPVQIASRVRQEQGTGTSPLISGKCGDTLWSYYSNKTNGAPSSGYSESSLKQYNGYYNYFNIGATGTGKFNIYLTGMQEAKTGGWTTRKAALRGGATKIAEKYINDYQHTIYYQKFNVHPSSSRNFWGQYMQNVSAAWSESRKVQEAYRNTDLLDLPFTFAIPVYSGMPSSYSDPGGFFAGKDSEKWQNTIDVPTSGGATKAPVNISTSINTASSSTLTVSGWSVHTDGVAAYQYSVDGNAFSALNGKYRADVASATSSYTNCTTLNAFEGSIDIAELATGAHNIAIRAKTKKNDYYLVSVITLNVTAPSYVVELDVPDGEGGKNIVSTFTDNVLKRGDVTYHVKGWSVHEYGISEFRYSLDNGNWTAIKGTYRADVAAANSSYTECTTLNAFEDDISLGDISIGSHTLRIGGLTKKGANYVIAKITLNVTTPSFTTAFDSPSETVAKNTVFSLEDFRKVAYVGQTYKLKGWSVHDDGIAGYQYNIDGGAWKTLTASYRADVAAAQPSYTNCTDINAFEEDIPLNGLSVGDHNITIRGLTKQNYYYTIANMKLTINPNSYAATLDSLSKTGNNEVITATDSVTKNSDSDIETYYQVRGWALCDEGVTGYQYSIDGGAWTALEGKFRSDVSIAMPNYTNCTTVNAFDEGIPVGSLSAGNHTIKLRMETKFQTYYDFATITLNVKEPTYKVIKVTSGTATLDKTEKDIVNIKAGTTVETLKAQLSHGTVTDAAGNVVTSGKLASGYKVIGYEGETVRETYTVIVTGDVDGDGMLTIKDILVADALSIGKGKGYFRAADIDNDGTLSPEECSAFTARMREQ